LQTKYVFCKFHFDNQYRKLNLKNMKKLTYLIIIAAFFLSNCDYLRKKGILSNQDSLKDDSLEFAAQMEKMKLESQAKIDSIQNSCNKSGNYHVITGSFRNPLNAENFKKAMIKQGFTAQIIEAPNGFNLVSTFNGKTMQEILGALRNMRANVNQESWVYVK
jgi:hypothetical protein